MLQNLSSAFSHNSKTHARTDDAERITAIRELVELFAGPDNTDREMVESAVAVYAADPARMERAIDQYRTHVETQMMMGHGYSLFNQLNSKVVLKHGYNRIERLDTLSERLGVEIPEWALGNTLETPKSRQFKI